MIRKGERELKQLSADPTWRGMEVGFFKHDSSGCLCMCAGGYAKHDFLIWRFCVQQERLPRMFQAGLNINLLTPALFLMTGLVHI